MKRLTPDKAVARIVALFSAMTGASVDSVLARRRGSAVDTARNLALHFLVEVERYGIVELGRAMGRHYSSVKNNHLRGWELREAAKEEIGDALFEWVSANWRRPLSELRPGLEKRRTAFWRAIAAAQHLRGSLKLEDEDLARAIVAMAGARSLRVKAAPKPRAKPVRTAVPVFDEPPAMQMLRLAPSLRQDGLTMRCEPAPGGGHFIRIMGEARQTVSDALAIAARMLFADAGFPGEQRSISHTERGWTAGLKVAPALAALLAVIHGAQPSPILPCIDGAHSPTRGPTLVAA